MGSLRAGLASFWTSIRALVDTDDVTQVSLYEEGINRLADRTVWLRAALDKATEDLASVSLGKTAKVTGSVDLSTLVYDPIAGDLNGLTLQVQSDTSGVITVTFGIGAGVAPTGPADVATAILAAGSGDPFALVGGGGNLLISSTTTGGTGTITIVGGTAVTVLGFTVAQTATGSSANGDGGSLLGVAAITGTGFNLAAGTLRSMLQSIANQSVRPRPPTRLQGGTPIFSLGGWTATAGASSFSYVAAGGGHIWFPLDLDNTKTLTGVSIRYAPPGGHSAFPGGKPATMPNFDVIRMSAAGVAGTIGSATDASSTVGIYEASHALALTGLSEVIDTTTYTYWLYFQGETGANSITGLSLFQPSTTST